VCERTKLTGDDPGAQRATGTGSTERIGADLCLVSIGYRGLPIDEATESAFDDETGILRNDRGRVLVGGDVGDEGNDKDEDNNNNNKSNNAPRLAPLYVSGWLKRGPSGIIGTNIGDAKDTVATIVTDLLGNNNDDDGDIPRSPPPQKQSSLADLLVERGVRFVDWESYRRIEDRETTTKRHPDQPREKLVGLEALLEAATPTAGEEQR